MGRHSSKPCYSLFQVHCALQQYATSAVSRSTGRVIRKQRTVWVYRTMYSTYVYVRLCRLDSLDMPYWYRILCAVGTVHSTARLGTVSTLTVRTNVRTVGKHASSASRNQSIIKIPVYLASFSLHFTSPTNRIANLGTLKLGVGVRLIALTLRILLESTSNGA